MDDLLRDQVDQDIIRGRLGRGHRRDSSAQITTIDTDDCVGIYGSGTTTPPLNSKRRRSSLAQVADFIGSLASRDKGDENRKLERGASGGAGGGGGCGVGGAQPGHSRRGTLAEISKNLPWGRRESQAEVMSKIRKRRETSADITIFRKSSAMDMRPDINRYLKFTLILVMSTLPIQ